MSDAESHELIGPAGLGVRAVKHDDRWIVEFFDRGLRQDRAAGGALFWLESGPVFQECHAESDAANPSAGRLFLVGQTGARHCSAVALVDERACRLEIAERYTKPHAAAELDCRLRLAPALEPRLGYGHIDLHWRGIDARARAWRINCSWRDHRWPSDLAYGCRPRFAEQKGQVVFALADANPPEIGAVTYTLRVAPIDTLAGHAALED